MRPGMARGLAGGWGLGSVWGTGMVVPGFMEQSKNFLMGFLMRLYVGCGRGARRSTIRDGLRIRCRYALSGAGRWSENLSHRLELFHRAAQMKRTECRIDSR